MTKQKIETLVIRNFRKNKTAGACTNASLEKACGLQLSSEEKCLVCVDTTNKSSYHITTHRIVNDKTNCSINYQDINNVYWMVRNISQYNGLEKAKLKKEKYDTLVLEIKDKPDVEISHLGNSWNFVLSFLSQYLAQR